MAFTKSAQQETKSSVRLPLHRMSWQHITDPEEAIDAKSGKKKLIYRYTAWIPGDSNMDEVKELYLRTKEAQWSKGVPASKKNKFIVPYRKADESDYEKSPQLLEMKGNAGGKDPYIMSVKSHNRAPGVLKMAPGKQKVAVEDGDIYSGIWCLATITMYAYDNQSIGASASLQNILKMKDDAPLGGGGVSASVDFDDVDAEEYGISNEDLLGVDDDDDLDV